MPKTRWLVKTGSLFTSWLETNWMPRSTSSAQHLVASFLLCCAMVSGIAYWHRACVIAQVSPSLLIKPPNLLWRPQFMTSSNPIYSEKGPPSHDIKTWFWGVSYCLDFVFLFSQLDNSENYLRRGNHNRENVSIAFACGLACGGASLINDWCRKV